MGSSFIFINKSIKNTELTNFFPKQFGWVLQLNKYEIVLRESIIAVENTLRLSSLAIQVVHQLFGQLFGQLPRQSSVFSA